MKQIIPCEDIDDFDIEVFGNSIPSGYQINGSLFTKGDKKALCVATNSGLDPDTAVKQIGRRFCDVERWRLKLRGIPPQIEGINRRLKRIESDLKDIKKTLER